MIRKFITALIAIAVILGGFAPLGGLMTNAAEASGAVIAVSVSDCANMVDMKASQDGMNCPSMDDDAQDSSMKCPAKNCTIRCGTFSDQPAVVFANYYLPAVLPELPLESQAFVSTAGKPPLRPPSSILI